MNFFVDFEATQPGNEIISIGVICENGQTFETLVRPVKSKITPFITQLTGIKQSDIDEAPSASFAFNTLYRWLLTQSSKIYEWNFFCYGKEDKNFLETTAKNITWEDALVCASVMNIRLVDVSGSVKKFFHGSISLINAYNYVKNIDNIQKHQALEDAKMLMEVIKGIDGREPLKQHPLVEKKVEAVKMPSGTFTAKHTKNGSVETFEDIESAIDWMIYNVIKPEHPEVIHRDRIMKNIMKSTRKGAYANYKWSREKKEENLRPHPNA